MTKLTQDQMRPSLFFLACLISMSVQSITEAKNNMTRSALSNCPDTPNCVSSVEIGTKRYVEPLSYQGSMEDAKEKLLDVINTFERTQLVSSEDAYIHATFTSFLFGFVDDVEFMIDDSNKLIDMRSASRVGLYDFEVNRRRCENIRNRFLKQ